MRKLLLMCFLFVFAANVSAQVKVTDQMKTAKTSSEKAVKEKEAAAKAEAAKKQELQATLKCV